jgi:hypothetical protein
MKGILPICILMLACQLSFAQQFKYSKKNNNGVVYHQLINGIDTAKVASQIKSKSTLQRIVISKGVQYRFKYDNTKRQDQILNSQNQLVATTVSFYDITTIDGTYYDNTKISNTEWKYGYNNKDVVRCKFIKTSSGRAIEITWLDASIADRELIEMMCMVYGVNLIQARAIKPVLYGLSGVAIIVSALATPDKTPSTN